jgi:hypothetical protein
VRAFHVSTGDARRDGRRAPIRAARRGRPGATKRGLQIGFARVSSLRILLMQLNQLV